MGCAFQTPMPAVSLTTDRWDDAPLGQNEGDVLVEIPAGSRGVHIVWTGEFKGPATAALRIAMDSCRAVYRDNGATALNQDGAGLFVNSDSDSPVVILPVPVGAEYLHLKGIGTVYTTFYGGSYRRQSAYAGAAAL